MSRPGSTYELGRSRGTCAATGETLSLGTPCVTALCEAPDPAEADAGTPFGLFLRRLDVALPAWEAGFRPAGMFCFWRTSVQEPGTAKRMLIDDEALVELFTRLEGDGRAARTAFRFVLMLLLIRKRLLKVVEQRTEAGPDGGPDREVWLVLPRGSESAPVRVENPRLKDSDVQEIADQLGEVLQGNW
jgi:hypothetical protein